MGDCNKCTRANPTFGKDLNVARLTMIVKRLIAVIVIETLLFVAGIIVVNAIWANLRGEYDTVSTSYEQDGKGVSIIGSENEVGYNVAAFESEGAD